MKQFLNLLVIIYFTACNNATKKDDAAVNDSASGKVKTNASLKYIHSFTDTVLESKIIDALMKLPFVIKSNHYIDSFSNHRYGMAFILDAQQGNEKEISAQAGYNGGERFETYYRFFVNPKTMEIKVYDAVEDKNLTINEYLKTQH